MLPDYLQPGLRIVFCGTAAGKASAARNHYYAGPGNRFWRILQETGMTPRQLLPEEDQLMPSFGFGLTDLAKGVSGQDRDIPKEAFAPKRLFELFRRYRPQAIAFTSLTAARVASANPCVKVGRMPNDPLLPDMALWALPSPSGLARSHFSLAPWQALADWRMHK